MTTSRQLGYESQKVVLQYLDPNTRIFLSNRCPTVQTINKMFPLNIPFIRFNHVGFQINDTHYKLGVTRQFVNGPIPDWVLKENESGGVRYDLERFADTLDSKKEERIADRFAEMAINESQEISAAQKRLAEIEYDLWNYRVYNPTPGGTLQILELEREMQYLQQKMEHIQISANVQYYHCIQLTVRSTHRKEVQERVMYDRRVYEAENYFLHKLFSQFPNLQIKCMYIDKEDEFWKFQLPLPARSIAIEVLSVEGDIHYALTTVQPMLINPVIRMLELKTATTYSHCLTKNAIELHIVGQAASNCLLNLSNKKVIRRSKYYHDIPQRLVENWRFRRLPIGYHYTLEIEGAESTKQMMNSFRNVFGGIKGVVDEPGYFRFSWTFQLTETTELNVFLRYIAQQDDLHYIEFMIHPIGYARPYQWNF